MVDTSKCPCGFGNSYQTCCKPLHLGDKIATTAEQLMRSRYCAYVKKLKDYLLDTWHQDTRPKAEDLNLNERDFRWVNLKIIRLEKGLETDNEGVVEFAATYTYLGKPGEIEETSQFIKQNDRWFYTTC